MEFIRGVHNIGPQHHGCVLAIGNFDGVHLGHQAVFRETVNHARRLGVPATALIFEPQPAEFFSTEPKPRITRLREKLSALALTDIDRVLCVGFDESFAARSAEQFIAKLLVEDLGVRHIVVGPDFRFGRARAGDVPMLIAAGRRQGFEVSHLDPVDVAGKRVSSTAIRVALAAGDFSAAENLLGRPYSIGGRVAHGDARGRTIGFPTLNLPLHRRSCCLKGVFAVWVAGLTDGKRWPGVANIGNRPTVGGTEVVLEVHVLDFSDDAYGRHVEIEFCHRLRDETKFESLDALKQQIDSDVRTASAFFG